MQDLATFAKLNAQATERHIPQETAKGKYVVAHYTGLSFYSYSTHDTLAEAQEKKAEIEKSYGDRGVIHEPQVETAAA